MQFFMRMQCNKCCMKQLSVKPPFNATILRNVIKQETQANKIVMACRLTAIAIILEDDVEGMEEFTTIGKPWVRPCIGQRKNFGTFHTLKSLSLCIFYILHAKCCKVWDMMKFCCMVFHSVSEGSNFCKKYIIAETF